MKLKSLFLATLAAMAMVSCSNENDPITDNGEQAEKNALLQFRISFGNSVNTRAEETNSEQVKKEAGLSKEQKFSKALLIAAYVGKSADVIVKDIARDEFLPVKDDTDPASDGNYYQSVPFEVTSGTIKAYVILNPEALPTNYLIKNEAGIITSIKYGEAENAKIEGKLAPADVEDALKSLTLTETPDEENSFVMYGASTSQTGEVLNPNETTAVSVKVDRVTAKLKEETPESNLIDTSVSNDSEGEELADGQNVTITLKSYDFTNLAATSPLVYQSGTDFTSFNNQFDGTNVPTLTYKTLGKYTVGNVEKDSYDDNGNVIPEAQITYCWENEKAEVNEGGNITSIIYKGQITISGHEVGENVYVFNRKAYNHDGLKAVLPSLNLEDTDSRAEYEKRGIYKYENGYCYYRNAIKTGTESKIKRNNVYKLKVTGINSIGYPTPIPLVKKTMMQLYITVNEWIINENEFALGKE